VQALIASCAPCRRRIAVFARCRRCRFFTPPSAVFFAATLVIRCHAAPGVIEIAANHKACQTALRERLPFFKQALRCCRWPMPPLSAAATSPSPGRWRCRRHAPAAAPPATLTLPTREFTLVHIMPPWRLPAAAAFEPPRHAAILSAMPRCRAAPLSMAAERRHAIPRRAILCRRRHDAAY